MKPSKNAIDLIKKWEGLYLESYLCPAKVPTIGYGTIRYPDGSKVKMGEKISMKRAEELLIHEVEKIAAQIPVLNVNQNQYDALVSFVYNLGIGAFLRSTLYRKCQVNPYDLTIRDEFLKWSKARVNGELKRLKGLVRRRTDEYNLYAQI
jgi:lysozyme